MTMTCRRTTWAVPAEEMRFALPAAPSPPVQEFLLAGVQEAARGGGCYLSTDALALFIWRLGDAALVHLQVSLSGYLRTCHEAWRACALISNL